MLRISSLLRPYNSLFCLPFFFIFFFSPDQRQCQGCGAFIHCLTIYHVEHTKIYNVLCAVQTNNVLKGHTFIVSYQYKHYK